MVVSLLFRNFSAGREFKYSTSIYLKVTKVLLEVA